MLGKPNDVEGQCNAHLHISDDYGDNESTMRCYLPTGHSGDHIEEYLSETAGWVKVYWEKNQRPECCEGYMVELIKEGI
jgi:hypothetical protein